METNVNDLQNKEFKLRYFRCTPTVLGLRLELLTQTLTRMHRGSQTVVCYVIYTSGKIFKRNIDIIFMLPKRRAYSRRFVRPYARPYVCLSARPLLKITSRTNKKHER